MTESYGGSAGVVHIMKGVKEKGKKGEGGAVPHTTAQGFWVNKRGEGLGKKMTVPIFLLVKLKQGILGKNGIILPTTRGGLWGDGP